jgi:hypothetical protein
MKDRNPDTTASRGSASRTDVDVATGVLVGRCGITVAAAVNELFSTARDNRISLFELSRTVITLAEGKDGGEPSTRLVALQQWGSALETLSASEDTVPA